MNMIAADKLKKTNLRPTRQRLLLGNIIWSGTQPRHITAEQLHNEAKRAGDHVSLATVYNTLHQFTDAGLLNEVFVDGNCSYFDTNTDKHHHLLNVVTGELIDIAEHRMSVRLPKDLPPDLETMAVDVIIRVRPRAMAQVTA